MNFWATIEHSINYKFGEKMPAELKERLRESAEVAGRLDDEMSKIKFEIMDAQEVFMMRTSLVARIIKKIQVLYFSGNVPMKNIEKIQADFYTLRERGSIEELREMNRKLEQMNQKLHIKE